jgi:SAM-dependent methyltransferase
MTDGRPLRPPEGCCPACGSSHRERVLEQRAVPIHTSTLLPSREDAEGYPRGDLDLAVCVDCGLLTNVAFDAPTHDYSASYEEVQSFSSRFREYQRSLARTLVERHDLAGRDVLEIGCGRGDFLLELCAATGGRGFGVDPSFREERLEGEAADRISVDRGFFTPEHVPPGVGAVVCRHTLEHIHDVRGFLRSLRAGLVERAPQAVVVFEVPDTRRVLEETAFWDLFYEHCSYFTPGSFARAFRVAGLTPECLDRTFDDQYILLTARAGTPGDGDPLVLEETPGEVVTLCARFAEGIRRARDVWGGLLLEARDRGERAVIWGAGSKGVGFLSTLGVADEVASAVDINPAKHGMHMPGTGHEIVSPDELRVLRPGLVVVMNPIYEEEIARDLAERGVEARVVSL